jgi:hypothetical protein
MHVDLRRKLPLFASFFLLLLALAPAAAGAQSPNSTPAPKPAPARPEPPHPARAPESASPAHEAKPEPRQASHGEHVSEPKRNDEPGYDAEPGDGDDLSNGAELERVPPALIPVQPSAGPDRSMNRQMGTSAYTTSTTRGPNGELRGNGTSTSAAHSTLVGHPGIGRGLEPDSPEAQSILRQLNATRAGLIGVNKLPIPDGRVFSAAGQVTVITGDGRRYSLRPDGTLSRFQSGMILPALGRPVNLANAADGTPRPARILSPLTRASFRHDGRLVSLHVTGPNGIDILHGTHGERIVTTHLPDRATLVSTGQHSGYRERTVERDGQTLIQRTYVSGKRTWSRTYLRLPGRSNSVQVNGPSYKIYVPRSIYAPGFYAWVYGGWGFPVNYRWNWVRAPWYVYFSMIFAPWPTYPDGSYWLTDFAVGQTMEDGYDMEQPDDGSAGANASDAASDGGSSADSGQAADEDTAYAPWPTAISVYAKQEIAAQVQKQLAAASVNGGDSGQAPAPDDPSQFLQVGHMFVVSTPITVRIDDDNAAAVPYRIRQCNLSPGDVLRLTRIPEDRATTAVVSSLMSPGIAPIAFLEVEAGQRADCPGGAQVAVQTTALGEMENNFQAQLDDGLHLLSSEQGKNGLPAAPASAPIAAQTSVSAALLPDAADVRGELLEVQAQADQAEAQIAKTVMSAQTALNQP